MIRHRRIEVQRYPVSILRQTLNTTPGIHKITVFYLLLQVEALRGRPEQQFVIQGHLLSQLIRPKRFGLQEEEEVKEEAEGEGFFVNETEEEEESSVTSHAPLSLDL